ncbi:MAG: hypothetical protein ACOX2P_04205 [Bacillota bacterium]
MIISGALKPDEKIPSVRELAQMLTIKPKYHPKGIQRTGTGRVYLFRSCQGQFRDPAGQYLKRSENK